MRKELSQERVTRAKEIVLGYLQGESLLEVKFHLQVECEELGTSCRAIYKAVKLDPAQANRDPFLHAILGSLNLEPDYLQNLIEKSRTLYELLNYLYQDGNQHVGTFIKLTKRIAPPRNWTPILLLGTLLSAALGTFFHFKRHMADSLVYTIKKNFPLAVQWIKGTFTLLRNVSLVGLIQQGLILLWTLWNVLSEGTRPVTQRLSASLPRCLPATLTMTAYLLSYFAGGVMTFPAAILFVGGAGIHVFTSLQALLQTRRELDTLEAPARNAYWEAHAQYLRMQHLHQYSIPKFTTRLVTALLTTLTAAIWVFFPPSLIVTTSIISFTTLIGLVQQSILNNIDTRCSNELQTALGKITVALSPALSPEDRNHFATLLQKRNYLNAYQSPVRPAEEEERARTMRVYATRRAISNRQWLFFLHKSKNLPAQEPRALEELDLEQPRPAP